MEIQFEERMPRDLLNRELLSRNRIQFFAIDSVFAAFLREIVDGYLFSFTLGHKSGYCSHMIFTESSELDGIRYTLAVLNNIVLILKNLDYGTPNRECLVDQIELSSFEEALNFMIHWIQF